MKLVDDMINNMCPKQLYYTSWENTDEKQELNNYFTNVNVVEVMKLVDDMINSDKQYVSVTVTLHVVGEH